MPSASPANPISPEGRQPIDAMRASDAIAQDQNGRPAARGRLRKRMTPAAAPPIAHHQGPLEEIAAQRSGSNARTAAGRRQGRIPASAPAPEPSSKPSQEARLPATMTPIPTTQRTASEVPLQIE